MTATGSGATFTPNTGKEVLSPAWFSQQGLSTCTLLSIGSIGSQAHTWPQRGGERTSGVFRLHDEAVTTQQEEGAEDGLLNKQPTVSGTQTKDSVEHRCRILGGVHTLH